jgi:hypothetical protein
LLLILNQSVDANEADAGTKVMLVAADEVVANEDEPNTEPVNEPVNEPVLI